jgi:hypothetical protein
MFPGRHFYGLDLGTVGFFPIVIPARAFIPAATTWRLARFGSGRASVTLSTVAFGAIALRSVITVATGALLAIRITRLANPSPGGLFPVSFVPDFVSDGTATRRLFGDFFARATCRARGALFRFIEIPCGATSSNRL